MRDSGRSTASLRALRIQSLATILRPACFEHLRLRRDMAGCAGKAVPLSYAINILDFIFDQQTESRHKRFIRYSPWLESGGANVRKIDLSFWHQAIRLFTALA